MELHDVYDINRIKTGETIPRGTACKPGQYRLAVHMCIFNASGEMLVQQRQPFKQHWPDMWDYTAGGSALAGEDSRTAAMRELYEEIGVKADLSAVRPAFTINYAYAFDDYYLLRAQLRPEALPLQQEEVKAVRWASMEEVFSLLDAGQFCPNRKSIIALAFESAAEYAVDI